MQNLAKKKNNLHQNAGSRFVNKVLIIGGVNKPPLGDDMPLLIWQM